MPETRSRASTRPSALRMARLSTACTRGTSLAMNSLALSTGSALGS